MPTGMETRALVWTTPDAWIDNNYDPATTPKFDPATRAYLEFTDAGPVVREGLRRQVCDVYTENWKRQMAK